LETDIPQEVEDWVQKELKILSIEKKLNEIGEQCKELLQLFYVKAWSMEDIAKKIGLRNDKVAKAQKYRCIQKLKDKVQVDFEILNPLENFSSLDSPHSSFESIKF
jgi:DNA-directed RNA polymerase specialized sigma24 family protein